MSNTVKSVAITAQNQFSDAIRIADKKFSVSVRGTMTSLTVTLQRKLPSEDWTAARDVESWTAIAEKIVESVGSWDWRIGCKTGNFSSGTGVVAQIVEGR